MKVLLTTDLGPGSVNGVIISVQNLRRGLAERGHDVRILTLSKDGRSYCEDGIYYISSHNGERFYPGARVRTVFAKTFLADIWRWKPDIIHSNCELSTFITARNLSRILKVPLVHTYHTFYEDYTQYFIRSRRIGIFLIRHFTRHISRRVDILIAPTEKIRKVLEGYRVSCPIAVIPTGIDISLFSSHDAEAGTAFRERYGIGPDEVLLLFCGRIAKEKDIGMLLDGLSRCHGSFRFMIAGDGPDRKEVERKAAECGIDAIFTGMLDRNGVAAAYRAADAFVSASRSETQGLTYIEALSSGLPLICRDDEVLDGVVYDGVNGFRFQDADGLGKAADAIIADSALRQRMGAESDRLGWKFSLQHFAESVEGVYRRSIGSRRG